MWFAKRGSQIIYLYASPTRGYLIRAKSVPWFCLVLLRTLASGCIVDILVKSCLKMLFLERADTIYEIQVKGTKGY